LRFSKLIYRKLGEDTKRRNNLYSVSNVRILYLRYGMTSIGRYGVSYRTKQCQTKVTNTLSDEKLYLKLKIQMWFLEQDDIH